MPFTNAMTGVLNGLLDLQSPRACTRRRMLVDEKSYDLVEHFLQDVKGATPEQACALAEAIQTAAEDFLHDLEERNSCQP